jgi:hypothetical protein
MKRIIFSLLIAISFFGIESCGLTDDTPGWSSEDKESYEKVLKTQDDVSDDLEDWFQSMDSLDAIEKAYQSFMNDDNVSSATINSQGIAVQYSNGIRGGLFLNPKDDAGEEGGKSLSGTPEPVKDNGLKSLVNNRKMIFINPHYYERSYFSDQIIQIHANNLVQVEMTPVYWFKNSTATLDQFASLTGNGFIHVYSHGFAWPKQSNITDVYLLTGETANETTSKKYWDDLTEGNIPIIKIFGSDNKYFIAPEFISKYNDFSKDTVLFYGGFCYSFLGGWPDLTQSFADGAYLGFDWSVYTFRNANWSVNLISGLSDTSKTSPMTLEEWMNNSEMEKSYWNSRDERTVNIQYTGDGNLTLWENTKVTIIALSGDGTPVNKPGEAGVAYPFKCEVNSSVNDLEYIWDIGDGSSPVSASNEVNITWSENGSYTLSVQVHNKANNEIIGNASVLITIGEINNEVLDVLHSCEQISIWFGPDGAFNFSPAVPHGDANMAHWSLYGNLTWNGLNFSGTFNRRGSESYSISGSVSADGQKVSFTATADVKNPLSFDSYYKIDVKDLPLYSYETDYPNADYSYYYSPDNYVTNFEGTKTVDGTTGTVTGVNWGSISKLNVYFEKDFK